MAKKQKAVVLLSGGIDSSTALAIAQSEGYELFALSFDYNQKHRRELQSARMVASALSVSKHLVIAFDLRGIGGSALTSEIAVPKAASGDTIPEGVNGLTDSASIPLTYVPARNTIFLSFALAWAEVLQAGNIYIGANAVDYSGYPDCRPEYLKAFEHMADLATKASVEKEIRFTIQAPLLFLTKSEIIQKGIEHGLDFSLTWSCYDPQPSGTEQTYPGKRKNRKGDVHRLLPCGQCDSCFYRAKGFREAGEKDPLLR